MWAAIVEKLEELEQHPTQALDVVGADSLDENDDGTYDPTEFIDEDDEFDLRPSRVPPPRGIGLPLPAFTVRKRDDRREGSSFPVGSIAAQLLSPTTDRIPLSVASERTGWTAHHACCIEENIGSESHGVARPHRR